VAERDLRRRAAPRSGWGSRLLERLVDEATPNRGYSALSLAVGNLWEGGDRALQPYRVSSSGRFGFDFYRPGSSDPLSSAVAATLAERCGHLFEQAWLDVMQRSIDNQRILTQALAGTSTLTTTTSAAPSRPTAPAPTTPGAAITSSSAARCAAGASSATFPT
jgi:hypothetical protein